MSELGDRRARKKARTREQIRCSAQQLFAEHGFDSVTIADVAATADVAVQTVFNHFPAKEELFFAGRTPWVHGPAEAVRSRPPGQQPLAAVHEWTSGWVAEVAASGADEERRAYLATMTASPALRAFELSLLQRAERGLADALIEAWSSDPSDGPHVCESDLNISIAAELGAALWVAGARSLLVGLRAVDRGGADTATVRGTVTTLAEKLFDSLERGLGVLLSLPGAELPEPALNLSGPSQAPQAARRAG